MKTKRFLKDYTLITLGMTIVSAAIYFFMIPGKVVAGGVSGLVLVLSHFLPLPISVMTLILNVILLILAFLFIGREFGTKNIYTSLLLPVYLGIFETILPNQTSLTNDTILDSLCYVLLISLGTAILFNANASSGGMDIVAKLLNKFFHMEIGKALSLAGIVVASTSILVYDTRTFIISILTTYFNGIVLDHFIVGFNIKKRVCILSENYPVIQEYILKTLNRGVTLYSAIGGYDNTERTELITILTRSEYIQLMNFIQKTDPQAFVTVYMVNEISGAFKTKGMR